MCGPRVDRPTRWRGLGDLVSKNDQSGRTIVRPLRVARRCPWPVAFRRVGRNWDEYYLSGRNRSGDSHLAADCMETGSGVGGTTGAGTSFMGAAFMGAS